MNTDYLREFVTFAGFMNYTAAARALNVSQPTLSRHVAELERHFGCTLVDRSADALKLTFCGSELLRQATRLLEDEEELARRMEQATREPRGALVLERYRKSPVIHGLLAVATDELRRKHPGFSVTRRALSPGDTAGEAVLRGDVDADIVACTTDETPVCPVGEREGFGVLALDGFRERILFALPAASELARRDELTLADLAGRRFVFPLNPEFGRCLPDVSRMFARRGLALRHRPYELADVEELGLMDIGPDEVFIVVEGAAASPQSYYLQNPNLVIVPCAENILVTRYLVWRKDDTNPALAAFLNIVRRMQEEAKR